MCSAKRFVVTASLEDLHNDADPGLEGEFSHMVSGLSQHYRVSRLHSIVVYPDNRDTVLGMLLDYKE